MKLDVTSPDDIAATANLGVDVLINNAGTSYDYPDFLLEVREDDFTYVASACVCVCVRPRAMEWPVYRRRHGLAQA